MYFMENQKMYINACFLLFTFKYRSFDLYLALFRQKYILEIILYILDNISCQIMENLLILFGNYMQPI